MGEALLGGLLTAGWAKPMSSRSSRSCAERRDALRAMFPGVASREP